MRNYIMELIGAFFLTLALSFTTNNAIAVGFLYMTMLYIGYHVSGAHYNPAVSLAVWVRGKLKVEDLFIYTAVQCLGAFLAIWLLKVVTHQVFSPEVSTEVPMWVSLLMEILLTGVLCLVYLTVTQAKQFKGNMVYGAAVGLALAGILFIGGVFNPSVSFASMVCNFASGGRLMGTEPAVIYLGGPLVGGALAAFIFDYLND